MFGRSFASSIFSSADPYSLDREHMIEHQLRPRGIVMHSVLDAMRIVPRHLFVPHAHSARAYADEALPSSDGQTISQPYIVAAMTQELRMQPGQRILEIGTGTGYQTAILAGLAGTSGQVFTIERSPQLAHAAQRRLDAMDVHNVQYLIGDGSAGWPQAAPFDRILVTAGTPRIPLPLLRQLADHGILVIPRGLADSQILMRVERQGRHFTATELFPCRFVPLIGTHAWPMEPA